MAVVSAFALAGIKCWFWSDDHEPPHFHAKKAGEWEVQVHFLLDPGQMIEIVWSAKRPATKTLAAIASLAQRHRVELLDQWEGIHQ